jgi:hypothetical protein
MKKPKILAGALLAGAMVSACPLPPAHADSTTEANAAAAVFRAMENDVERCFARTKGNVFVLVEALLDDRGRVRRVEATGDARADVATRRCVERRVARATFPVPHGGGTSRVRTSFFLAFE